ncbi:MAG: hypothetical protein OEW09_07270 [Anaerolineae bacterium]|nr:hypothetical protein [Anaerolineae bacterium]
MDARKEYVAPAIAAEDTLEQTSLACNATAGVPIMGNILSSCFAGQPTGNFTQACGTDVAKGGAFVEQDPYCSVYLDWPAGIVVLS